MKISGYEESESTQLGEVPEGGRMRGREGEVQDVRGLAGRRGVSGPYHGGPRSSSAPMGYMGLRGGQGHPAMEDVGVNGMVPFPGMHPGMQYPMPHPGVSPHSSMPPQYASYESMNRYPYPPVVGGAHIVNPHAAHPPRPPPPSTSSPPSSPKSPCKRIPPSVQAVVDAAVQKRVEMAGKSRSQPVRSKTSPATFAEDKSKDWGAGIDTCICTMNCKCRKGERAIKWYEGTANIGGEEVPIRAKLNTRFVLKDDTGKDCGDHTACRKSSSSSSSSSDTEDLKSRKNKRKDKKRSKKSDEAKELERIKSEIEKMKKAATLGRDPRFSPSVFPGYGPGLDPSDMEGYDPAMMHRLRIMEMSNNPYSLNRVGGMDAAGRMQGLSNPMTTHNLRGPRVPPKLGMRMEDHGDMGGASPGSPHAWPSAVSGKGRVKATMPSKGRARFGLRGGLSNSDSELSTTNRRGIGKRDGSALGSRQARSGKIRPYFELDDTDVSFGPRRQSGMKGFGDDAMYNLPGKSCIVSVVGLHLAEPSIERTSGDRDDGASPRNERSRVSPLGRRGGVRNEWIAGKQARAETDDEENY